jgi:cell division protein FtsQ
MKKLSIYLGVFLGVVGLGFFGAYSLYKSSVFHLKTIEYQFTETNSYVNTLKPAIENELNEYVGKSLWNIDIFKLEKSLKTNAWIESVSLARIFPNELVVQIEPKKVAANILKSPSRVQPVAEDATVMESVEITKSPSAPLLSHRAFSTNDELRKTALAFLKELPDEGSFSRQNISEIIPMKKNKNLQSDLFRVLLKNSKVEVLINTENVPLKAARVSRVIDYLGDREMEDRIIDANFSKKVLVRPRNHR